jgi:hypothetical protein
VKHRARETCFFPVAVAMCSCSRSKAVLSIPLKRKGIRRCERILFGFFAIHPCIWPVKQEFSGRDSQKSVMGTRARTPAPE